MLIHGNQEIEVLLCVPCFETVDFYTFSGFPLSLLLVLLLACTASSTTLAHEAPCFLVGSLDCVETDTLVTPNKVEAALYLASDLAKVKMIGRAEQDSILSEYRNDSTLTLSKAAELAHCNQVLFTRCDRFFRLVRTEVTLATADSSMPPRTGVGYAAVTYANDAGMVADPAILSSAQRALTFVLDPAPRFDTLHRDLRVLPARLVAVSGIEFTSTEPAGLWQLFKERTITSYDLVQTIVGTMQHVDTLVTVDIETRDSMFALAGFQLAENDRGTSQLEMRVLRGFDVSTMITGTLSFSRSTAMLTLSFAALNPDGTYQVLHSASQEFTTDSKTALREAADQAVRKLFAIASAPPESEH